MMIENQLNFENKPRRGDIIFYHPPKKLFKNKMLRRRCGKVDKKAVVNRLNLY